ncbi:MAG: O-antigen ligase family protein, partial [Bacteroidota bacterium]
RSEFHQPLLYGLLSQRDFAMILTGLAVAIFLRGNIITVRQIRRVLLLLAWVSLVAYSMIHFVVNPLDYFETPMVGFNALKGGYIFRFNMTLIIFGSIYYAVCFFQERQIRQLLAALLFLSYLLFIRQDRTIVVSTVLALLIFFVRNVSWTALAKYIAAGSTLLVMGVVFTLWLNPESVDRVGSLYYRFYEVLQGFQSSDATVDIRVSEIDTAMKYIRKNPVWGSGELSRQWNDGWSQLGRFFPSDIGFLGLVFIYGIGGLLLIYSQTLLAAYYTLKTRTREPFCLVCQYFLVAFYLNSLSDGVIVWRAAIGVTFLAVIQHYYRMERQPAPVATPPAAAELETPPAKLAAS